MRAKSFWNAGCPAFCLTLIGLISLTIGCTISHSEAPETVFNALEKGLLDAQIVHLAFHVTSEGVVSTDIHGTLDMKGGTILLKGNGLFAGDSVDLVLRTDHNQVEFGNRSDRKVTDSPPELRDAILIGLTRMGILHNLARLTGSALPDHADGGAKDWVVVDSFAVDPRRDSAVSFALIVGANHRVQQPSKLRHLVIRWNVVRQCFFRPEKCGW